MTVHDFPGPAASLRSDRNTQPGWSGLRWFEALPWTGISLTLAVGGLLLIVALPRSLKAERALAVDRMEMEMQQSLRKLRGAIHSYHADHGVWPGSTPAHPFGPYLPGRVPVNPANGLMSIIVLAPGESLPAGPDGLSGWIYTVSTGQIRANCEGVLQRGGIRYYDL